MPPNLLSNLLKALRYSSGNIRNIGINSPYWPHGVFQLEVTSSSANLHMKHTNKKAENGRFCMENWQFFKFCESNYSVLLSDNKPNEVASFCH